MTKPLTASVAWTATGIPPSRLWRRRVARKPAPNTAAVCLLLSVVTPDRENAAQKDGSAEDGERGDQHGGTHSSGDPADGTPTLPSSKATTSRDATPSAIPGEQCIVMQSNKR